MELMSAENLTFSEVLTLLKNGQKMARKNWNGKNMFIYYVPKGAYKPCTKIAEELVNDKGLVEYSDYIAMKTAQGNVVPWLASQTDLLSNDWQIVD